MSDDTTMHLERTLSFSRDRVYATIVSEKYGLTWWAPDGYTMTQLTVDARVGGAFNFIMQDDNTGDLFESHATYNEVVPNERLVWTNGAENGVPGQQSTHVTLELSESDGSTTVSVTHSGFPDAATRDMHVGGWTASLMQLEALMGRF